MGQIISNNKLNEIGAYGKLHINAEGLSAGAYYYTLTKPLLIQEQW